MTAALRLEPFRGLMMSGSRIGDPASARAFARPYRDVARRLLRWERSGRLDHDDTSALYLHEYTAAGITVRGLVGALDLPRARALGAAGHPAVLPHEDVHGPQAAELAERMQEMGINPAPILLVHRGPAEVRQVLDAVAAEEPLRAFTDRAGNRQRVWAVRDGERLAALQGALEPSCALLADGHHRYDAYLRIQAAHAGTAWDRGLAMLVDQDDTPLFLGAIHRLLARTSLDQVLDAARDLPDVDVEVLAETTAIAALGPRTMVATDGQRWATLATSDADRLAVQVLHDRVLPAVEGAPPPSYHHSVHDLLTTLVPGRDVALMLPSPAFDDVHRVVASGRLLPEKATSFQPKPGLGVLMRSLRDG